MPREPWWVCTCNENNWGRGKRIRGKGRAKKMSQEKKCIEQLLTSKESWQVVFSISIFSQTWRAEFHSWWWNFFQQKTCIRKRTRTRSTMYRRKDEVIMNLLSQGGFAFQIRMLRNLEKALHLCLKLLLLLLQLLIAFLELCVPWCCLLPFQCRWT